VDDISGKPRFEKKGIPIPVVPIYTKTEAEKWSIEIENKMNLGL
jgi:hypothetical protein